MWRASLGLPVLPRTVMIVLVFTLLPFVADCVEDV